MTTATTYMASIVSAISQLTITGITIKDIDEVAASWVSLPKVLYPNIDDFVTNFELNYPTFVQDGTGPVDIKYSLNYRYLSTQVGDMATVAVQSNLVLAEVISIVNKMLTVRAPYDGRVLMTLGDLSIGARLDPAGNQYFGADFALNVEEIQN